MSFHTSRRQGSQRTKSKGSGKRTCKLTHTVLCLECVFLLQIKGKRKIEVFLYKKHSFGILGFWHTTTRKYSMSQQTPMSLWASQSRRQSQPRLSILMRNDAKRVLTVGGLDRVQWWAHPAGAKNLEPIKSADLSGAFCTLIVG